MIGAVFGLAGLGVSIYMGMLAAQANRQAKSALGQAQTANKLAEEANDIARRGLLASNGQVVVFSDPPVSAAAWAYTCRGIAGYPFAFVSVLSWDLTFYNKSPLPVTMTSGDFRSRAGVGTVGLGFYQRTDRIDQPVTLGPGERRTLTILLRQRGVFKTPDEAWDGIYGPANRQGSLEFLFDDGQRVTVGDLNFLAFHRTNDIDYSRDCDTALQSLTEESVH